MSLIRLEAAQIFDSKFSEARAQPVQTNPRGSIGDPQLVGDPSLPWCEFGVGEGESLDWFLLNKPRGNVMFGFDTFEGIPEPWLGHPVGHWKSEPYQSNRPDLEIVRAPFDVSVNDARVRARLAGGIGLMHVDCDLYSSTRTVLEGMRPFIGPGTVIVFDELYGYGGWQQCEAGAFRVEGQLQVLAGVDELVEVHGVDEAPIGVGCVADAQVVAEVGR